MIIDIYTHIYPNAYYETMNRVSPQLENLGKRMRQVTKLHDLDERFREMDNYGDYRQVISLPQPPIEDVSTPGTGPELARVANDSMAEMVAAHPDRFAAFVAAVCMHNMEATLTEIRRDRLMELRAISGLPTAANRLGDSDACAEIDDDRLTIHHGCATDLKTVLLDTGITEVDYIVSSLPLSILDDRVADEILAAAQASLGPGGKFLQYQYSLTYLRRLTQRYGDVRLGFTLRNVPPAFIYECVNEASAAAV